MKKVTILVWDLPVRVFHWLLVALVVTMWITGNIGGDAMVYHAWCGCAVLILVVFRILWGFFGGTYARFKSMLYSPREALGYVRSLLRGESAEHVGHNPIGVLSVFAMLLALLVQACLGLFANDDIMTEGPLFDWVSKDTSDSITAWHLINANIIGALVGLHLAAVLFYLFAKRQNLIVPMLTGRKQVSGDHPSPRHVSSLLALVLLLVVGIAVFSIVGDPT